MRSLGALMFLVLFAFALTDPWFAAFFVPQEAVNAD